MSTGLEARLDARTAVIGVIGLGTVGLASAAAFGAAGFRVIGVDVDEHVAVAVSAGKMLRGGEEPELPALVARLVAEGRLTATTSFDALAEADAALICVPTPMHEDDGKPNLGMLFRALEGVARVLRRGALVVVESTLPPGTMKGLVTQTLGWRDFLLGHAPERVMPGKLLVNLRTLPRTCGASDAPTASAMTKLYRAIAPDAQVDVVDLVTAEIVKTAENAYRDVQIAFANEVARVCENAGADFMKVRELVNRSPGRVMLVAGAGVGGACIPKDGRLLASMSPEGAGQLLSTARAVNDAMPAHVVSLLRAALAEAGRDLDVSKVALLGWSYLPDSGDTRGSPTEEAARLLVEQGAEIVGHDPHVAGLGGDLYAALEGADAAAIMVAHAAYAELDLARVKKALRTPVLVDGRFVVAPSAALGAGLIFRGIGRG